MLSVLPPFPAGQNYLARPTQISAVREPRWQPVSALPLLAAPQLLRSWLCDKGSLTRALRQRSEGQFAVTLLRQGMARVRCSESRLLGLPQSMGAIVREVILHGQGQDWVFARSIMPLATLSGRLRSLRHLDNRPLGELLFSDPAMRMRRGAFEVARVKGTELPLSDAGRDTLFGRRSVFYLDGKPLMVSEFFLADFVAGL